jgi:hypothetical protein
VVLAGGTLCLLGGYLVGAVTAPDSASRTTAVVDSYDRGTQELCLTGDSVDGQPGGADGKLCGTWRRSTGDALPRKGDRFRFVSIESGTNGDTSATYIYGSVVG